jgi:SAM-dependent methyltransferase
VDYVLSHGVTCVTVLDISGAALAGSRARLGNQSELVTWLEADVTADWPVPPVDIWHDRAVFHFLVNPSDRAAYIASVRRGLRSGGSLIIATFGPDGPETCSGLPTVRYSPERLAAELGSEFQFEESVPELHQTPSLSTQSFLYSRFSYP